MPETNEPIQHVPQDLFAERQAYVDEMFNSGYDFPAAEAAQADLDHDREIARIAAMEAELAQLDAENAGRWEVLRDLNLMAEFEEADQVRAEWESVEDRITDLRANIQAARGM